MRTQQRYAICEPGGRLSPDTETANALILDFQKCEKKFSVVFYKPSSPWDFVVVEWTNTVKKVSGRPGLGVVRGWEMLSDRYWVQGF
jgi:hypothetical protein